MSLSWKFQTILDAQNEVDVSNNQVLTKDDESGLVSRPRQLMKTTGHGKVFIMTPLLNDRACSSNCTAFGATCVNLDSSMKKTQCVCPNGLLLDHINNKCEKGQTFLIFIQKLLFKNENILKLTFQTFPFFSSFLSSAGRWFLLL